VSLWSKAGKIPEGRAEEIKKIAIEERRAA